MNLYVLRMHHVLPPTLSQLKRYRIFNNHHLILLTSLQLLGKKRQSLHKSIHAIVGGNKV